MLEEETGPVLPSRISLNKFPGGREGEGGQTVAISLSRRTVVLGI